MSRLPVCLRIRRRDMVKSAASAAVLAVALTVYLHRVDGEARIADSLFLTGLLFLVIGCWNLVRWLGLFDYTVYGYKKLFHHLEATRKGAPPMAPMPEYADYLAQPRRLPSAGEPLLTAAACVALSLIGLWLG